LASNAATDAKLDQGTDKSVCATKATLARRVAAAFCSSCDLRRCIEVIDIGSYIFGGV